MTSKDFRVLHDREGEWASLRSFLLEGVRIPHFFSANPASLNEYIVNFQTRADDVFVVSYPKSGTTWMQEILWQLYNSGEISSRKIFERVPMLERGLDPARPDVRTLPSPRLLHTHLPYDVIPKGDHVETRCKYVYIARNPKDVAVSFYEFMKEYGSDAGYSGPWHFFAKLFVEGKVHYGLWNSHVVGWWKHKDDPNVLFLKYEDLKQDLSSNVRLIAEFLDKQVTEDVINRIAEQCSFEAMVKNMKTFSVDGRVKLLRKGEVGDWKNYFTPDIDNWFESKVMNELKGTGLTFQFENIN